MRRISRREFIRMSAGSAVMLGAAPLFTGCRKEDAVLDSSDINARVAVIRGSRLDTITRDAIEAIGGMSEIVHPGETVFIKPNFVNFPWARTNNCFRRGECTKPEIIIAVAEECLKAGAADVIIGDGSHLPSFDWQYAATFNGSTDLVREAARLTSTYDGTVTLACLEDDSPGWVDVPSSTYLREISISSLVAQADRVISIPVAKTHSWAQLTLGCKNFIGVTSLERYAAWINNSYWDRGKEFDHSSPRAIAQIYLDIVAAVEPDLTVIDFSIGVEGDGPTTGHGGLTVDMQQRLGSWVVLASTDIMAADATAARIMSHDVSDQVQLQLGYDMGLGEIHEQSIEIVGEKIDDVRVDWLPADLRNQAMSKSVAATMACALAAHATPTS
ncbi:MAG: DUF362 domain-containing protein [Fidelibacterota bacterium]|nr:MAG: DUF362 domain-containing protein [Candidatus Neomarinimicrobiota bacterium]